MYNIIHNLVENNDTKTLSDYLNKLQKKGKLNKLINEKNDDGMTPLHTAIAKNNQEIADELINYGADIRIPTDTGYRIKFVKQTNNKKIYGNRYL
jgi:ankyrin repeat protein